MSDFFDKAKDLLAEHRDAVDDAVDKVAGLVDDKTGGKHKRQVHDGAEKAKDAIARFAGSDEPTPKRGAKPRNGPAPKGAKAKPPKGDAARPD
jgi:hypothetical protein